MIEMLSISKQAEKCSYWSTKKLIWLKQKDWSKRGYQLPTRGSDYLSRQFLITASTLSYSSKTSSAEHIHTLPTCLTLINTLTHIDKHTHTHTLTDWLTDSLTHSHTHTHTHTHTRARTETCIKRENMFGWGICGVVWKGKGGGQELFAEVIRAPGWGSR